MNDIFIGLITSSLLIVFLEIFKSFDKRLIAALTLVGIAFIYVGFAWNDLFSLGIVILGVLIFTTLAYFGYTYKFNFIVLGLILHGLWDLIYPLFSLTSPKGYDKFCLTVDFVLAIYFYKRTLKK